MVVKVMVGWDTPLSSDDLVFPSIPRTNHGVPSLLTLSPNLVNGTTQQILHACQGDRRLGPAESEKR